MSRIFNAFYFAVIPSEVEGARGVSFKDAFRDPSTFARDDGLPHLHRHFISAEQALPKMVPGEIFHYPLTRGSAHFRHDLRMLVKMFDGGGDGIDIARWHNDAIDPITHHIARFTGDHLWQTTGRRFVSDLGAAFQL